MIHTATDRRLSYGELAADAVRVAVLEKVARLDDAVAVVADHMGAAKKGLAALVIEWDDGPHAGLTTEASAGELKEATLKPGTVAQTSATSAGRWPAP